MAVAACVALPAIASAHIERASYWPDPAPDTSVSPPAGGKVPKVRTLTSALKSAPPGKTHVVCKGTSLTLLKQAISRARRRGYDIRPHDHETLSRKRANRLLELNIALKKRCAYREIQPAVNASRNNDRIVIMPGIYTEPTSRKAPKDDPRCDGLEEVNDRGQEAALSYAYQYLCPNDQNLIAILGRSPRHWEVPQPPREDRHGIPDEGRCLRCNLQIEGSGVSADDVIIDSGRVKSGNRGPMGSVKDVGIRADRADGFVLQKMTVRHSAEHDIYVPETDGARLQQFKTFYNGEYGVLTFVADHHLIQDCEAMGSGDAAIYPGSSADTGEETIEAEQRISTELRRCDMHHSAAGYSGTAANAVHIHHNNFYDNALGFTTDVFTAAGHPGFPQDSDLVEHNNFFSNNFNPFLEGSDVEPTIPVPVGTGLWIAGGNNNEIRNNRFWDNWRRGTMVFTVPDQFVCGDNELAGGNHQAGCREDGTLSTSFDNRLHDNVMGRRPNGTVDRNGTDFWWDQFPNQQYHDPPTTTGNCWFDNVGSDGTAGSVTSDPPAPLLPSNCDVSLGTSGPAQENELLSCFADFDEETPDIGPCDWFTTPPEPKP